MASPAQHRIRWIPQPGEGRTNGLLLLLADDEVMDSFYEEWERWVVEDERKNRDVELHLARSYRRAWKSGDSRDRYAVLCFIEQRRESSGFDLVIEALRSQEPRLAPEAAAIASALIADGFDVGSTIRRDLEEFARRFPAEDAISIAALGLLDRIEKRTRRT